MGTRQMYAGGDINNSQVVYLPDGRADIIFTRRGDPNRYHLVVERLYQPDERVIIDEVLPPERG